MKKPWNGFTLAELVIGLVVGAIVVLMIGALGTVASRSYTSLRSDADASGDAQYAVEYIRGVVLPASKLLRRSAGCLQVDSQYFYVPSGQTQVVSGAGCDAATNTPVISGLSGLVLSVVVTPASPNDDGTVNGKNVVMTLSGSKAGVSFSYTAEATRRTP